MVRRCDVEKAVREQREARETRDVPAVPVAPAGPAVVPGPTTPGETGTRIPITGIRKTIADRLSRSRREIPEATVWVDVDATELLAARALLNACAPETVNCIPFTKTVPTHPTL